MTIRELIDELEREIKGGTPDGTLVVVHSNHDGDLLPVDQLITLTVGNVERVAII